MGWESSCPSTFYFTPAARPSQLTGFVSSRRLGIEGLVMFKRDITKFDADNYTVTIPGSSTAVPDGRDVTISVFDKVVVNIEVEKDKNTQKGKVKMTLVHPIDSRAL